MRWKSMLIFLLIATSSGCGNSMKACNEAKDTARQSWEGQRLLATGSTPEPACAAAASRAVIAATGKPAAARAAAEAAAVACPKAALAKSDSDRAWKLCSEIDL